MLSPRDKHPDLPSLKVTAAPPPNPARAAHGHSISSGQDSHVGTPQLTPGCAHPQGQGASSASPRHLPQCSTRDAAAPRAPADGHFRLCGVQGASRSPELEAVPAPPTLTPCHAAPGAVAPQPRAGQMGPQPLAQGRPQRAGHWPQWGPGPGTGHGPCSPQAAVPRGSQCAFQQPEVRTEAALSVGGRAPGRRVCSQPRLGHGRAHEGRLLAPGPPAAGDGPRGEGSAPLFRWDLRASPPAGPRGPHTARWPPPRL